VNASIVHNSQASAVADEIQHNMPHMFGRFYRDSLGDAYYQPFNLDIKKALIERFLGFDTN